MRVIVGSRELWPTPAIASAVLAIMASVNEDFAVRASRQGLIASGVEELALKIGEKIPRTVTPWEPGVGTSATFTRDNRMVAASSGVYAFFAPGHEMQGGTGHVVAVALRTGTAVEAFHLDDEGQIVEIGSDPGDLWALYKPEDWSP